MPTDRRKRFRVFSLERGWTSVKCKMLGVSYEEDGGVGGQEDCFQRQRVPGVRGAKKGVRKM